MDGRAVLSAEGADAEHDVQKYPSSIKKVNLSLGPGIARRYGRDSALRSGPEQRGEGEYKKGESEGFHRPPVVIRGDGCCSECGRTGFG